MVRALSFKHISSHWVIYWVMYSHTLKNMFTWQPTNWAPKWYERLVMHVLVCFIIVESIMFCSCMSCISAWVILGVMMFVELNIHEYSRDPIEYLSNRGTQQQRRWSWIKRPFSFTFFWTRKVEMLNAVVQYIKEPFFILDQLLTITHSPKVTVGCSMHCTKLRDHPYLYYFWKYLYELLE